ncbi:MAG TPA: hypothetical protein PKZ84_04580 [Anaerolineae bacterium]|nr:hypothetical protein [Anaerolineae bacterium]HQI83844.1 hypothetical protein [Anaerolineae bacterium]
MTTNDIAILRDLAERYTAICNKPVMNERRALWRRHNSLKRTRPLIYVRAWAWQEMPESELYCADPFFRHYEDFFRQSLFRDTFDDDFIFEPWVTVNAACVTPPEGVWGLPVPQTHSDEPRGSYVWDPPLKTEDDLARMHSPHHRIDEAETERRLDKLRAAIGDLITINLDRGPAYRMWQGDISTELARLRGLEQMMWDMMDRPAWLRKLLAHMRDGILRTHDEAERAGDWSLSAHQNQAMPYAEELVDPAPNSGPVARQDLWYFAASQETTAVGPRQFDEFMFQYQLPIMKPFGLVAYGCCEDLTRKIDVLRQLPNLRRIAISPMANVAKCAAQIKQDYVLSYRPSPSDMVGYGFRPDFIRDRLTRDLEACGDCHVDITLKDVETVQGDPDRVRRWVEITREVIARVFVGDM